MPTVPRFAEHGDWVDPEQDDSMTSSVANIVLQILDHSGTLFYEGKTGM